MFIHFGQHNYGKVDVVPDLCYVTTSFFHINFVPLIPLGSWIVVVGTEKGEAFQGKKIGLSLKSILTAWLRTGLSIVAIGSAVFGVVLTIDYFDRGRRATETAVVGIWGVAVGAAVALWLTYRFNRAGYDRAVQLGSELDLDPVFLEKYLTLPRDDRAPAEEQTSEPEGWERYR
jgi:hypothetical protein